MNSYRVTSTRLSGFEHGSIVTDEQLAAVGADPLALLMANHLEAIRYDEPKKHKGARKDATDTEKD